MTDEELQMIIAKDQGFTEVEPWLNGRRCFELRGKPAYVGYGIDDIPNYPQDLNAMHEAEKSLSTETYKYRWGHTVYGSNEYADYHQLLNYGNMPCHLLDGCGKYEDTPDAPQPMRELAGGIYATARQRAMAYVLVRKLALP